MDTNLLGDGVDLMLIGMGTVFVFLTLLVFAMSLMSRVAVRVGGNFDDADPTDEEVAAISAAISQHRGRR